MYGTARLWWTPLAVLAQARRRALRAGDLLALARMRISSPATAFRLQLEPRSTGQAARGLQILAGNYLCEGRVIENGAAAPWGIEAEAILPDLHGFAWLDDLVAVDTPEARDRAQEWVFDWIVRYGSGSGAGWRADLTGRRIIRWIHHALLILQRRPPEDSKAYFTSLSRQARFLSRRWRAVPPGLPRFEALAGLIYAGLSLDGLGHLLDPALKALARECKREIADDGALPDRDPEAMAEVVTLLAWVNLAVSNTGARIDPEILKALDRLAPALRSLRLGDGYLARFHGSTGGRPDRVDQALSDTIIRTPALAEGAMGYSRLASNGTIVLADTAPLPAPHTSRRAHASSLAFEMSCGRTPIIANMGAATHFGADTRRQARASEAHSTLTIDGISSARFIADGIVGRTFGQRLIASPKAVTAERDTTTDGLRMRAWHDGYRKTHGLIHERILLLGHMGNTLLGQDRLYAGTATDRERLRNRIDRQEAGVMAQLHFHAHPDVEVSLDMGGRVAALRAPDSTWILRTTGGELALEDAKFIEAGRLQPRSSKQVVVTWSLSDYDDAVTWTLSRSD